MAFSQELVLHRNSTARSQSVSLLGITAVLGSQAAPAIAPYAKELFYRILMAIIERLFRSAESFAMKYLQINDAKLKSSIRKDEPATPEDRPEEPKRSKTAEMLEAQRTAAGNPPCPFGSNMHEKRGPPAWVQRWQERRAAWRAARWGHEHAPWMNEGFAAP
ncbi:MAG: hypothetical protein M1820_003458 [Bogoriella megaspora]|nr:MAG: hypothetical protein M1820_003458 [Bogoriella megaspora]